MKSVLLSAFLLVSSLTIPAQTVSTDYPVKIHVISSDLFRLEGNNYQRLVVSIEGKKYILARTLSSKHGFHTGDYAARVTKDKAKNAAEYDREYELKLDDGKTVKFTVIGESE